MLDLEESLIHPGAGKRTFTNTRNWPMAGTQLQMANVGFRGKPAIYDRQLTSTAVDFL